MRVDVDKYLFVGPITQRDAFFEKAQKAGLIEFINPHASISFEWPAQLQQLKSAYKIIKLKTPVAQEAFGSTWTTTTLTEYILDTQKEREQIAEQLRQLRLEIARIEPFGEFDSGFLEELENRGHFFSKSADHNAAFRGIILNQG